MFKKIRIKFIAVAMGSISLVLFIIMLTVNLINYNNVDSSCDTIINQINSKINPAPKSIESFNDVPPQPKPEEIGENRYFVVNYDESSKSFTVDDNYWKIQESTISKTDAVTISNDLYSKKATVGYYGYYRYRFMDNKRYIFLDGTNRIDSAKNFMLISIYASIGGLTAFFLLIFFGSKFVLKPVKESYEKQKRFITNASHELKTPLTVISANNELLEMNGVDNEYTKNIDNQVARLNKLIKNLVNYSKMSEVKTSNKENLNFSEISNKILENYKFVCEDLKIKLNVDIDKDIIIKQNKEILNQIILIIMDNARKYCVNYINFSLKVEQNQIVLTESNDTTGIENGDLSILIERFYRGNSSRSNSEGSGIGLSVLNEICKANKIKLKLFAKDNIFNIVLNFHK